MVAYTDVPTANMLYEEQGRLTQGIALIDAGGKVQMFTVSPPPYDAASPPPTPTMMMMSVSINTIDPPASLMASVRDEMVTRSNAITAELAALGVTESPPAVI
jgi:hypothetical protein